MGNVDEVPPRDFKKNRNMSTNSHNGPLTINLPNGSSNFSPQAQSPMLNSPTIPSMPPPQSPVNPNMLQPTTKMNGQNYSDPQTPKSPSFVKVSEDHRLIIEGVRLAMDLI